jgi:nitrite reductase (NADH) large subunit
MNNGEKKAWRCNVCGYNHTGDAPPEICPICGVGSSEFKPWKEMLSALDQDPTLNPDPEPAVAPGKWRCKICGYVHEGPEPPDICPLCGASKDQFEAEAGAETAGAVAGSGAGLRVLVAGAGIAGISAVEAVREAAPEARVTLVSQEDLPYYRLNLTRFLAGEVTESDLPIHSRSWYADQKIDLKSGISVSGVRPDDHAVDLSNGTTLSYDKLILTVGAHPFIPPFPGAYLDGSMALRTVDNAKAILERAQQGSRCVCIGGGILGLETAGALAGRGVQVTLLEGHTSLMPRQLNRRAGELLGEFTISRGIDLLLEARTAEIVGPDKVTAVRLEDGTLIPADLVVITTGVRPNSFHARQAGLEVNHGVVVDNHLKCSNPDIFAAGDVAEHRGICYGIWSAAQYMGKIAGLNAAGADVEFGGIPMSNTLKVLGYDMFSIGRVEPADGAGRPIEEEKDGNYCRFLFRDGKLIGAVLLGDISASGAVRKAVESGENLSSLARSKPTGSQVLEHLTR